MPQTDCMLTSRDIDACSARKQLLIGGEWRDAAGGKTMPVVNPGDGRGDRRGRVGVGAADVDAAVAAARAALAGPWGKMSARERGRLVWKLGERLMEQIDEVARLETLHNGKPITESRHIEIPMAAECLQYFAGWADKIHGETIPVKGNALVYTLREPLGVVARDRAVELPAAAGDVEGRAGAGDRQHGHPQAREPDAADGARARRARASTSGFRRAC